MSLFPSRRYPRHKMMALPERRVHALVLVSILQLQPNLIRGDKRGFSTSVFSLLHFPSPIVRRGGGIVGVVTVSVVVLDIVLMIVQAFVPVFVLVLVLVFVLVFVLVVVLVFVSVVVQFSMMVMELSVMLLIVIEP